MAKVVHPMSRMYMQCKVSSKICSTKRNDCVCRHLAGDVRTQLSHGNVVPSEVEDHDLEQDLQEEDLKNQVEK